MTKLYKGLPRGFFCLVAVLMILSMLAVPSREAFPDEPCGDYICTEEEECVEGFCLQKEKCPGAVCDRGGTVGCAVDCNYTVKCTYKNSNQGDPCSPYMCQKLAQCDPCDCKYVVGKGACVCDTK